MSRPSTADQPGRALAAGPSRRFAGHGSASAGPGTGAAAGSTTCRAVVAGRRWSPERA